jgi:hypothetical protein
VIRTLAWVIQEGELEGAGDADTDRFSLRQIARPGGQEINEVGTATVHPLAHVEPETRIDALTSAVRGTTERHSPTADAVDGDGHRRRRDRSSHSRQTRRHVLCATVA